MSQLTIYHENHPQAPLAEYNTGDGIARELAKVRVRFERWITQGEIPAHATNEAIIAAYQDDINRLVRETGYQTYDMINMYPKHPQKTRTKAKVSGRTYP